MDRTGWGLGLSPKIGRYGRGWIARGGDLFLPQIEHSHTVYCDQAHYGPMSGGRVEDGVKGGQAVVGSGSPGFGGDVESGSGSRTDGGGGGDGRDRTEMKRY